MSNVLIGIIGVILFIGLALAGALFLGPRFQESTNNSKAAAIVQSAAQVGNAVNMYQVQNGTSVDTATQLQTGGFLKSVPVNPLSPVSFIILDLDGRMQSNALTLPFRPAWVVTTIGDNAAVCEAIERQSGNLSPTETFSKTTSSWVNTASIRKMTGCYKNDSALPGGSSGEYLVYSRI